MDLAVVRPGPARGEIGGGLLQIGIFLAKMLLLDGFVHLGALDAAALPL